MTFSRKRPSAGISGSTSDHVFISYSHSSDSSYVERLADHLAKAGLNVWFDREIITGDQWAEVIRERVETCVAFVVVMTPAAEASKWVSREIMQAEHAGRPIMPLLLSGHRFFSLANIQYDNVPGGRMPGPDFVAKLTSLAGPPSSVPELPRHRPEHHGLARRRIILAGSAVLGAGAVGAATIWAESLLGKEPESPATSLEVVTSSKTPAISEYHRDSMAPAYRASRRGTTVTHVTTDDLHKTLTPRLATSPPDIIVNDGLNALDLRSLLDENRLASLAPVYDALPVSLHEGCALEGTYFGTPRVFSPGAGVVGLWYSANLFERYGLLPPKDWAEFLSVCAYVKAQGILPYAYPGDAQYYQSGILISSLVKTAGTQALQRINNLEPGSWTTAPIKAAARAWGQFAAEFIDSSAENLSYTEVQQMHLDEKVAFYPCGSWLEREMAPKMPPGFRYAVMPVPAVSNADMLAGDAMMIYYLDDHVIPAKAANPEAAIDYLRSMLEPANATKYTEITGNLSSVRGVPLPVSATPGLRSVHEAVKASGKLFSCELHGWWYAAVMTEPMEKATRDLMYGRITGDAWCDRIQAAIDAARTSIAVRKLSRT